jgi:hypothetical protein
MSRAGNTTYTERHWYVCRLHRIVPARLIPGWNYCPGRGWHPADEGEK